MNDLISRKAAIDAINALHEKPNAWLDSAVDAVMTLPSVQSEQRWIPCSEKPPEEGYYLVWMTFASPENRMAVAKYNGEYWGIKTPISAYMPLPDPYGGEE